MKVRNKWLVAVSIIIVLFVAGVYVFIPSQLTLSTVKAFKCNAGGAVRTMNDGDSWKKWWPDKGVNGYSYHVAGKLYQEVGISLEKEGHSFEGRLAFIQKGPVDSALIHWQCRFSTSLNPLKRIAQYREAFLVRRTMDTVLSLMGGFLEKKVNIYGMEIHNDMSKDSCLAVTKWMASSYPTTADIYKVIADLRSYIASQGAKEIDYPMLHVASPQNGQLEIMVAVPIDRGVKANGRIFPRNFVPWKILTGEVTGGIFMAERGMEQMGKYLEDYQRTAMAVSFQSLVTERIQETDTSRWVTRIIVPVY